MKRNEILVAKRQAGAAARAGHACEVCLHSPGFVPLGNERLGNSLIQRSVAQSQLRRQDSNMRPPGYEPGELPTAPLRDIVFFSECKGTTLF